MKMKKNLLIVLLCVFTLAGSLLWARGTEAGAAAEEGPVTVTLLQRQDPTGIGNFKTKGLYKFILDKFNIDLDINAVANVPFRERYRVTMMSGDLPDFIAGIGGVSSIEEINSFGMSGLIYPINELFPLMPNLVKFYDKNQFTKEAMTAVDGNIYAIPAGFTECPFYKGLAVQKNMLDDVGFDLSTVDTFDDYLEMFRALKKANEGKPVMSTRKGIHGVIWFWMDSVGLASGGVYFDDAQEKFLYPFANPDAKYVVDFCRKLYEEGIYHPNILTMGEDEWEPAASLLEWPSFIDSVISFGYRSETRYKLDHPDNPTDFRAVKPPKFNGKQIPWRNKQVQSEEILINAKTEYADKIVEMLDWFKSVEGFSVARYGIEGKNWVMLEGMPRVLYNFPGNEYEFPSEWKEKMGSQADMDEWWKTWGYVKFAADVGTPLFMLYQGHLVKTNKFIEDYFPIYADIYTAEPKPIVRFSKDDQEEMISLRNSLDTAAQEMVSKIIVGLAPMSDWDKLQEQLKKIGVDKLQELYAKAYKETKEAMGL
jgi:putative aldouronate transport system substrate-binding protein